MPTPGEGSRRFEALRIRGHRGGVIHPHRSMAGLPWSRSRLAGVLLLPGLFLAGYALLLPAILAGWRWFFGWGRSWLGVKVLLGEQILGFPGGATLRLPDVSAITPQPSPGALLTAAIVTALGLGLSFVLPPRLTPVRALLRLLVVVQVSAILFFATSVDPFPYRIADYLFGLLATGLIAMGLVPLILAFTLYPLDLGLGRKIAITLFLMGHFAVFTPLLALVHTWLLLQGTALLMPVLWLGLGVLPFALVFLAGYGWAMSGPSELDRQPTPAPVHSA
jgi:hypothetical protein